MDLGAYSPLLERTYYQLGLRAQNLHRSQLPPRLPRHGERLDGFRRLDVEGSGSSNNLFDGMDLTLVRVADVVREGSAAARAATRGVTSDSSRGRSSGGTLPSPGAIRHRAASLAGL